MHGTWYLVYVFRIFFSPCRMRYDILHRHLPSPLSRFDEYEMLCYTCTRHYSIIILHAYALNSPPNSVQLATHWNVYNNKKCSTEMRPKDILQMFSRDAPAKNSNRAGKHNVTRKYIPVNINSHTDWALKLTYLLALFIFTVWEPPKSALFRFRALTFPCDWHVGSRCRTHTRTRAHLVFRIWSKNVISRIQFRFFRRHILSVPFGP